MPLAICGSTTASPGLREGGLGVEHLSNNKCRDKNDIDVWPTPISFQIPPNTRLDPDALTCWPLRMGTATSSTSSLAVSRTASGTGHSGWHSTSPTASCACGGKTAQLSFLGSVISRTNHRWKVEGNSSLLEIVGSCCKHELPLG